MTPESRIAVPIILVYAFATVALMIALDPLPVAVLCAMVLGQVPVYLGAWAFAYWLADHA